LRLFGDIMSHAPGSKEEIIRRLTPNILEQSGKATVVSLTV